MSRNVLQKLKKQRWLTFKKYRYNGAITVCFQYLAILALRFESLCTPLNDYLAWIAHIMACPPEVILYSLTVLACHLETAAESAHYAILAGITYDSDFKSPEQVYRANALQVTWSVYL